MPCLHSLLTYSSIPRGSVSRLTTTQNTLLPHPPTSTRLFSTSSPYSKKGGKAAREATRPSEPSASTPETDPFDLSTLETEISKTLERLKTDLSKLRSGGRFNPEALETLRVQPAKNNNTTYPLSDLAQVVPKGRTMQILISDEGYVKPVASAIQGSKLSLTPVPDPSGQNLSLIHI